MSQAASTPATNEPVYFWRESDPRTGWLSQWYECPFRDDKDPSKIYKTAEHYKMHHKALLFNDHDTARAVLRTSRPRAAKGLGRRVQSLDAARWSAHRESVVRRGNVLKFTNAITEDGFRMGTPTATTGQGVKVPPPLLEGSLMEMLLATGERELVEASPFDRVWGIGFAEGDVREGNGADRELWGRNLLGKALMDVRKELRERENGK